VTDKNFPWQATPSGAVFSGGRTYRYALWRNWDYKADKVLFVGLNPSKANEHDNDPTIRRCIGFARAWGFGGVSVANIYAYCATHPSELFEAADPVGADNQKWLNTLCDTTSKIICCWGNHGLDDQENLPLFKMNKPLFHLKLNKSGAPAHPLYLPKGLRPVPWQRPVYSEAPLPGHFTKDPGFAL